MNKPLESWITVKAQELLSKIEKWSKHTSFEVVFITDQEQTYNKLLQVWEKDFQVSLYLD